MLTESYVAEEKGTHGKTHDVETVDSFHLLAAAYLTANLLAPEGSEVPFAVPRRVVMVRAEAPVRGHRRFLTTGSLHNSAWVSTVMSWRGSDWLTVGAAQVEETRRDETMKARATMIVEEGDGTN